MNPSGLTAHGFCLSWAPGLVALHAGSDALIGLAYFSIPMALMYLARAKPEVRYGGAIYLFIAFILACGTTHFMSIFTLWVPAYGVEGLIKLFTAGISIATAILMWPLVRKVATLPSSAELARLTSNLTATDAANLDLARRIAEKTAELKSSNDQLQGIVATTMDGLITVDENQRIVLINPAAAHMFGVDAEQALGASIDRFIPERFRPSHADHVQAFRETEVTNRKMGASRSVSGLRANGDEFPLEASISQVEAGGLKLATVVMRDITEQKANEAARQLLAREVDHRAKNALAIVQAVVSLTQAPSKEAFVEAVRGRIAALARAHSLLAQNRWEGGDFMRIIADETEPYQKPGQVRIHGSSVILSPNAVQPISQIIHELATNAVKYGALSVDDGRVDIEVSVLPGREFQLSWTENNGPPVTEPASTGFGTTLITQIVGHQLKGSIDIAWPANGMRFTATFPASAFVRIAATEPDPATETKPQPGVDVAGARILVVEDELLISLELCAELRGLGWDVVGPASSVEQALRLIAESQTIDVAILDVNLAGELAYPVAERLRSLGVPFVFCTGYEQPVSIERFKSDPIVRKPVDIHQLTEQLHRLAPAA